MPSRRSLILFVIHIKSWLKKALLRPHLFSARPMASTAELKRKPSTTTTISPQIKPSGFFGSSTSSNSSTSTSVPQGAGAGTGVSSSQGRMSILTYELVDDTSPLIQYTGIWFGINNQSGSGSFGSPLGNTLHGSNGNGSFTFSFSGMFRLLY